MNWNIILFNAEFNIVHVERCERSVAFDATKDFTPAGLPDVVVNVANITFSKESMLTSDKTPGYFLIYCGVVDFESSNQPVVLSDNPVIS